MAPVLLLMVFLLIILVHTHGFHDCIQPKSGRRLPPNFGSAANASPPSNCSGGLCVGMHNGPHEGGPASYPSGSVETGFTRVSSTMSVPELPEKMDGICYYIWTDIFFGDMSQGRMNQFVPQLILGNALDGSSGPPEYKPKWGKHTTWQFGAHYFFEIYNETTGQVQGHAAYGDMYAAKSGEMVHSLHCIHQDGLLPNRELASCRPYTCISRVHVRLLPKLSFWSLPAHTTSRIFALITL